MALHLVKGLVFSKVHLRCQSLVLLDFFSFSVFLVVVWMRHSKEFLPTQNLTIQKNVSLLCWDFLNLKHLAAWKYVEVNQPKESLASSLRPTGNWLWYAKYDLVQSCCLTDRILAQLTIVLVGKGYHLSRVWNADQCLYFFLELQIKPLLIKPVTVCKDYVGLWRRNISSIAERNHVRYRLNIN